MQKKGTRICFIFNPSADQNRALQNVEWLKREAAKRWHNFEIIITKKGQDVAGLSRSKASDFDMVVACGGDGTVNNVVNGIAESDAALGVLPIGSGNDFVKTLELNKSPHECLQVLYRENATSIDLIKIEGDRQGWCANTLGIGLDGWANYYAGRYRRLKGHMVYALGALQAAFNFEGAFFRVRADDVECNNTYRMITACNGKWEGGSFYIAPNAKMDDGKMDLVKIGMLPLPVLLSYLPRFLIGPSAAMAGVHQQQCKKLEVWSDTPVAVHSDGEHLGSDIRHLKLTVVKKMLKIAVP